MTPINFTVIIPTYNYAHVVERAIQSVLNQPGDDYELIVINDGSTDTTKTTLTETLRNSSKKFRILNQANQGPAAARNRGVKTSQGSHLIFLDADDELKQDALKVYRDTLHNHPDADVILAGHESIFANGTCKEYKIKQLPQTPYNLLKAYLIDKKIRISNGAISLRRTIFDHYMFPEHLRNTEDIPLFSFALANYRVYSTPNPVARIHKHADSLRHNTDFAKTIALQLVEEIFDTAPLPKSVQSLRQPYLTQRLLSLSRTFFLSGDKQTGRLYFKQALKNNWLTLFNLSYSKKFIQSFF